MNIIRIEEGRKIHLINGIETASSGGDDGQFGDALSNSLLRLIMDENLPCKLFAYDVKYGIKAVDIIVGFLDKEQNLTFAWDKRVFPMIGTNIGYLNKEKEWISPHSNIKDGQYLYTNT